MAKKGLLDRAFEAAQQDKASEVISRTGTLPSDLVPDKVKAARERAAARKEGKPVTKMRSTERVTGAMPLVNQLRYNLTEMVKLGALPKGEAIKMFRDWAEGQFVPDLDEASVDFELVINLKKSDSIATIYTESLKIITNFAELLEGTVESIRTQAAEEARAARFATVEITGPDGKTIFIDNTTLKRIVLSVKMGQSIMLTGEPGAAKTDIMLAIPELTGRKPFRFDVSAITDVSEIEAQRVLEAKDGVSITRAIKTTLIQALDAAEAGEDVVILIDELPRVPDLTVLNPLLPLLSHGYFQAVIEGKAYNLPSGRVVVVATANLNPGKNFSGNNRRGLDSAFLDRMREIMILRPSPEVMESIVYQKARWPKSFNEEDREAVSRAMRLIYSMADNPAKKEIVTVRSCLRLAEMWAALDPDLYSLVETFSLEFGGNMYDQTVVKGIAATLEAKGY